MSDLAVRVNRDGDRSTIGLNGDLDLASVAYLRTTAEAELASGTCRHLVLDLDGLTFLDSSGIGCFVALGVAAGHTGATLELANPPVFATRLLQLAGLASTLIPNGSDDALPPRAEQRAPTQD